MLYEEFGKWEIVMEGVPNGGNYGGMDAWRRNNITALTYFPKAMFCWLEMDEAPETNPHASLHEWATVLALIKSVVERNRFIRRIATRRIT